MRRRQFGAWLLAGGCGLAGSLFGAPLAARPGGGQTFRKSNSSSFSGSSSSSFGSSGSSFSRSKSESIFPKRSEPLFSDKPKSMFDNDRPSPFTSRSPSTSPRSEPRSAPLSPPSPYRGDYAAPSVSSSSGSSSGEGYIYGFFGIVGCMFLGIVGGVIRNGMRESEGWSSQTERHEPRFEPELYLPEPAPPSGRCTSMAEAFAKLEMSDPNYSHILFEDFLYTLYAEAQKARGAGTQETLIPYFGTKNGGYRPSHSMAEVRDVVIGAMRIVEIEVLTDIRPRIQVTVEFEANYTEVDTAGVAQSYWVQESWGLERVKGVQSRTPEKSRVLGCPNCGAPLDRNIGATCEYCNVMTSPGAFDWTVWRIDVHAKEKRGPMLTGTTEEVGTDLPTVVAADVQAAYGALAKKDPTLEWRAIVARIEAIFEAFHKGWSNRDLQHVRPYLSDNLMAMQHYWIETYRAQGLRNVTENPRVAAIHLARVGHDKFFDSMTVRVYASCRDYTVNDAGDVMGGDRQKERQYSEYWTLIRGAERRGAPRTDPVCPNCGAPNSKINMAGCCTHCAAHMTSGEFDWVLSRIEQDETYGNSLG